MAESAASGSTTSGTLTPLRLEISPPTTTSVSGVLGRALDHLHPELAVVDEERGAGLERLEDLRMRQADPGRVALGRIEVEAEARALGEQHRAGGEGAAAQLRPLQVGEDADRPAELRLDLADQRVPAGDVLVGAVAHVEAEDVRAGEEQAADHLVAVGGRAEGRDDLDVALAAERGHARAIPIPCEPCRL